MLETISDGKMAITPRSNSRAEQILAPRAQRDYLLRTDLGRSSICKLFESKSSENQQTGTMYNTLGSDQTSLLEDQHKAIGEKKELLSPYS